jgi:hypothetical protein
MKISISINTIGGDNEVKVNLDEVYALLQNV